MNQIESLYKKFIESTGVSTDTRKIIKGNIFFALKGENFDGNQYADQALDAGATLAVIDDKSAVKGPAYFLVEDGLRALQELALYHRQQLKIPIVGLTGSNGKTTTKELIREVLATKYKVFATTGNFNNHIGVPLTLLSIDNSIEIGVIEMGANHIGEIAALCQIARPTHGLITNIGGAHLEGFGGYEGVLRAKSELYDFLISHEGQIFANSDDPVLVNMTKRAKNPLYYNNTVDFLACSFDSADPYVRYINDRGEAVDSNLIGSYNFKNIATALCVGKYFEVDPDAADRAIRSYIPKNNRSQIIKSGSNTIILDAYNANPVSMNAALDNLENMKHDNKVVILGDMFELGEDEATEHRQIAERINAMDLSMCLTAGEASQKAADRLDRIHSFKTRDELMVFVEANFPQDALILIKASRGMGLEKVAELLDR
jgi:UDP-N-acetylmuramoyl-tripeptide--D-alanyl-D-alanine ligase